MDDGLEPVEFLSREQALAAARAEAARDLVVADDAIRYVALVPEFHDYCLCEFLPEGAGWVKVIRLLTPSERLPDEAIPDERIVSLARSGDMISAIRLYRARHEVGLLEGKAGVEALLDHA